jgi:hypothetical protein
MRFTWMLVLLVCVISCTTGPAGTACQTPVQDACTQKAQDSASQLSKIASQQGMSESEITTEFMNACTAQVQHDLDETLADLEAISNDAGTTVTVQKDSSQ